MSFSKSLFAIVMMLSLTGCFSSWTKDKRPQDYQSFRNRHAPRDNGFIESGGYKKQEAVLPGHTNRSSSTSSRNPKTLMDWMQNRWTGFDNAQDEMASLPPISSSRRAPSGNAGMAQGSFKGEYSYYDFAEALPVEPIREEIVTQSSYIKSAALYDTKNMSRRAANTGRLLLKAASDKYWN